MQTNAFTSEDMTVYHETVPSSYLDRALYLEAERMGFLPAGLDQKKFDAEREVVKNERLQNYENVPYGLADEAVLANLYPAGAPYSWSVIGSMKDLNAATLDDLKRFFAEYYHPGNAVVCLSGDFDPAEAKRLIAKYFAPLKPGPAKRPVNFPEVDRQSQQGDAERPRAVSARLHGVADGVERPCRRPRTRDARFHPFRRRRQPTDAVARSRRSVGSGSRRQSGRPRDRRQLRDRRDGDSRQEDRRRRTADHAGVGEDQADAADQNEVDRALVKFEKQTYSSVTSLLGRGVMLAIHTAQKNDPLYYKKRFAQQFEVTPADVQRVAATYLKPERLSLYVQPMGPARSRRRRFSPGPAPTNEAGSRTSPTASRPKTRCGRRCRRRRRSPSSLRRRSSRRNSRTASKRGSCRGRRCRSCTSACRSPSAPPTIPPARPASRNSPRRCSRRGRRISTPSRWRRSSICSAPSSRRRSVRTPRRCRSTCSRGTSSRR